MNSIGFLLVACLCFALIYGMFKVINAAEDKSREWGLYYSFVPLFVHFVAPILVPVLMLAFLIGVVCLFMAFSK